MSERDSLLKFRFLALTHSGLGHVESPEIKKENKSKINNRAIGCWLNFDKRTD